MSKTHPTLYHRDASGKLRVWHIEQDGARYRMVSGLMDGQLVGSEWTEAVGKNVGRSNETTPEQQASLEIESAYTHKLERKYHRTPPAEGAARTHYLAPMLAKKWEGFAKVKSPASLFSQHKIDGIRCLLRPEGMFSREGKPIVGAPHVHEAYLALGTDLPLDGELYNHELKDDFNAIVSMVRRDKPSDADLALSRRLVQFHCYDLVATHHPAAGFYTRWQWAEEIIQRRGDRDIFRIVPTFQVRNEDHLDKLFSLYLEDGYEGQMVRLDAPYEHKRSKTLLKRKEFMDEEFELTGVFEGVGNRSGMAGYAEFKLPGDKRKADGKRPEAGLKGTHEFCRELLRDWQKYDRVTVQFFGYTPAGIPRFPVAVKWHLRGEARL